MFSKNDLISNFFQTQPAYDFSNILIYAYALIRNGNLIRFECSFGLKDCNEWTYHNSNGLDGGGCNVVIKTINARLNGQLKVTDGRGQGNMTPNFDIYRNDIKVSLHDVLPLLASLGMNVVVKDDDLRNFLGLNDRAYSENSHLSYEI